MTDVIPCRIEVPDPELDELAAHPVAVAVLPGDGALRSLGERSMSLVRWKPYDRGGHVVARQATDLLIVDVRAVCGDLRTTDVDDRPSRR